MKRIACLISTLFLWSTTGTNAQSAAAKPISPDLFGIFFEDINWAADGGLYAELVQNRSFEYNPSDKKEWHSLTAWEYTPRGFAYGSVTVETTAPIHPNNPHYVVLTIEDAGQEGLGLTNSGYDGIVLRAGEQYQFSVFIKQLSDANIPVQVRLQSRKGVVYGDAGFTTQSGDWKKYTATITASQNDDSASLQLIAKGKGKLALDMVSLMPQKTFRKRSNGLRADLAQVIADLHPKFMRFPGGCLVHGDGLGNMYQWKKTLGPLEQRIEQRNIWNYHQSVGLGYFEYFQFCEDIGAKAVPVVPAAVSCQNSGGTWRIGGTGQKGLPMEDMQAYIQDLLDLVEYANGPASSTWGAVRAAAGHPEPFHLQYIGVGNEDKITPEFKERFQQIYTVLRAKHPEITIIGTVGPAPAGSDFEQGWQFASQLGVPVVDEHYYESPEWFLNNLKRYDTYNRKASQVYLGEYASRRNKLGNALAEAAYCTSLERNGDIVRMASYAPLLGRRGHTQWNPNLIYYTGTTIYPTVNYYVQQLFATHSGDLYLPGIITAVDTAVKNLASSVVKDSKTGDIILKLVNTDAAEIKVMAKLPGSVSIQPSAMRMVLKGDPAAENSYEQPQKVVPETDAYTVTRSFAYTVPAHSLTVIRIKTGKAGVTH